MPAIQIGAHCWCGACYAGCAADSEHSHAVGLERLHQSALSVNSADKCHGTMTHRAVGAWIPHARREEMQCQEACLCKGGRPEVYMGVQQPLELILGMQSHITIGLHSCHSCVGMRCA